MTETMTPARKAAAVAATTRFTGVHAMYVKVDEPAMVKAGDDYEAVKAVFAATYPTYAGAAAFGARRYVQEVTR